MNISTVFKNLGLGVVLVLAGVGVVKFLPTPSIIVQAPMETNSIQGVQQRLPPFERTVLSAGSTTTVGSAMNVADYQNVGFTIATQLASSTVQVACSMADTAPNFASTASSSNRWGYVNVVDYQGNNSIAGNTGFTFAGSSTVRQIYIPNSNFRWCTVNQSNWTAGTTTATLLPATNQ